jgi:hypothetical protein
MEEVMMRFANFPAEAKRLVPVAFVKLMVVTVLEPAEKLPVRFSVVPEAFAKRMLEAPRFVT